MSQNAVNEELLHIRKRARRRLVGAIALVLFALTVLWTVLDNTPPPQFASGHAVEIVSSAPALMPNQASVVAVVQTASGPEYLRPPVDAGEVNASAPALAVDASAIPVAAVVPVGITEKTTSAPVALPGKLVNRQTAAKPTSTPKPKHTNSPIVAAKPAPDPAKLLEGVEERKAETKPVPTAKPAATKFYLQIGAFGDAAKAAQLVAKLKGAGFPAYSEKIKSTHNGTLTRVRVGPAATEAKANEWRRKAEAVGISGKVVK